MNEVPPSPHIQNNNICLPKNIMSMEGILTLRPVEECRPSGQTPVVAAVSGFDPWSESWTKCRPEGLINNTAIKINDWHDLFNMLFHVMALILTLVCGWRCCVGAGWGWPCCSGSWPRQWGWWAQAGWAQRPACCRGRWRPSAGRSPGCHLVGSSWGGLVGPAA